MRNVFLLFSCVVSAAAVKQTGSVVRRMANVLPDGSVRVSGNQEEVNQKAPADMETDKALHGSNALNEGVAEQEYISNLAERSASKVVNGIPIYGYDEAYLADAMPPVLLRQNDTAEKSWYLFKFNGDTHENDIDEFCEQEELECDDKVHPDHSGLHIQPAKSSKVDLDIVLSRDKWKSLIGYADTDAPIDAPDDQIEDDEDASLMSAGRNSVPWGLDRVDDEAGLDGSYMSPGGQGKGVHVYVLDTGVAVQHTDFGGRAIPTLESIGRGRRECRGTTPTWCRGGRVSCSGDCNGHGTHCAGTVAGTKYGVAKKAIVHGVKVLNPSGATHWITGAMDWVLTKGIKPAIISMSLGGSGRSRSYMDATDEAVAAGVAVIVAAGNSNADACHFSPAFVPAAITVGATSMSGRTDIFASYSNYGSCIDIWAPGTGIVSAHHLNNGGRRLSGTSMACPHVAGAAALALGENPSMSVTTLGALLSKNSLGNMIRGIPSRPASTNKLLHVAPTQSTPTPPTPPASGVKGAKIEELQRLEEVIEARVEELGGGR